MGMKETETNKDKYSRVGMSIAICSKFEKSVTGNPNHTKYESNSFIVSVYAPKYKYQPKTFKVHNLL